MADRFYTADALRPGEYQLTGPEAHHLHAVRRIDVGERITLFNGDGFEYPAEVLDVGKKSVALLVAEAVAASRERTPPLWIASALPKGDRLDFLIEKLTELGVTRFVPLVTDRSIVRPKADVVEKYQRMVVEASKQCGRNVLMTIDPPASWAQFVRRIDLPPLRLILHPGGSLALSKTTEEAVVAIGPEGGFSESETAVPGWAVARLGPTILRIETAAIAAACSLL
ncbi:RsmE family RNA methyltransferase [Limnoglobus roseus]|uniref:Ribosomal RNA small subunit methyltransferase E n=1 Tax=Limnoglobus roseus TaxID=2598579 RepID=A0A5C1A6Z4_9BACT|nr:RsmE family RNA methyltransferase [Limnoglobus roseus]QEL14480.1 16S rRNA (uracil(1498)-N(3))-methyltransferase [Limnoglobus roseus]